MQNKPETVDTDLRSLKELEEVITRAIKKVNGRKENDLCRYLPMATGGYMHHFTLRKMKSKKPSELGSLIEKFIISPDKPGTVAPKQRAARGSRKRRDQYTFTHPQLERMLNFAKLAGDKEMITILSPRKSIAHCKRDLIASIRHGKAEPDLWNSYVEALNAQQSILHFANENALVK